MPARHQSDSVSVRDNESESAKERFVDDNFGIIALATGLLRQSNLKLLLLFIS